MKMPEQHTLEQILASIRRRFYQQDPANHWHRDQLDLIKNLTWPALWMHQRGITVSQPRYRKLLEERLDAIARHGDSKRWRKHFPTYLLKCLQDHFAHHGEELYEELKHIRNVLFGLESQLKELLPTQQQEKEIDAMARTHQLLNTRAKARRKKHPNNAEQLELF